MHAFPEHVFNMKPIRTVPTTPQSFSSLSVWLSKIQFMNSQVGSRLKATAIEDWKNFKAIVLFLMRRKWFQSLLTLCFTFSLEFDLKLKNGTLQGSGDEAVFWGNFACASKRLVWIAEKRSGLAKLLDLLYSQIPQPGTSLPAKFVIQCGPHLAMLGSSGKCLVGLIRRNVVHQEADAILTSRGMLVAPTGELKRSRQHWAAGAGAPLSPPCTIYLLFPTSSSIG